MHFFRDKEFLLKREWAATDGKIYSKSYKSDHIDEIDLKTQNIKQYKFDNLSKGFITSNQETLVITKLVLKNTYIARVKLPSLAQEINKQN